MATETKENKSGFWAGELFILNGTGWVIKIVGSRLANVLVKLNEQLSLQSQTSLFRTSFVERNNTRLSRTPPNQRRGLICHSSNADR